jgi:signal transduction histidine kinase
VDASDRERRRIAGDLHDGPIQDLSGLAMSLTARAQKVSDPEAREAVSGSAEAVRASVRTLRSAIVGVYPPNLQQAGLGPALSDLTARLPREGLDVSLDVAEPAGYAPVPDELLYRACQEALRNVESHAQASRVTVSVRRRGTRAVLEVVDDGVGPAGADGPGEDGHMGLRILRDLVTDAGGSMNVAPGPDGGTVLRVEVPVP